MEIIHPLSHVAANEVNGSQPVGSRHQALKIPSDCARDSDWMIHLYRTIIFFLLYIIGAQRRSSFFEGVPSLRCLNFPKFVELLHGEFGVKAYPEDHVCMCDSLLREMIS